MSEWAVGASGDDRGAMLWLDDRTDNWPPNGYRGRPLMPRYARGITLLLLGHEVRHGTGHMTVALT